MRGDARDVTLLVPVRARNAAAITMLQLRTRQRGRIHAGHRDAAAGRRNGRIPRDVTLVLDVSGSMHGRKIEQARAAGRQLLRTLRDRTIAFG